MRTTDGLNGLTSEIVGVEAITEENKEIVRKRMIDLHKLTLNDAVVFAAPQGFNVTRANLT